ncbi:unnamed protein product, partial [Mesorhabditis spiculigera]
MGNSKGKLRHDADDGQLFEGSWTIPSAPATRVRVVAENSSEIRPIAPPTEIEEDTRRPTSPPLRSYKMEEHENPFKPQEQLYHEVDPIVEQYLHKPFPPSHPGSANTTPVKQPYSSPPEVVKPRLQETAAPAPPPERESPAYYQNGLSINDIGFEQEKKQRESQPLVDQGRPDHYSHKNPNGNEELPPANTVEMVHIKKKKCGCCSLQ